MVNPKRIGFLTGAVIAGAAVYAFYALTNVTDDDRLTEALGDHCLPYVTAGTEPFVDIGRTAGVFDGIEPLFVEGDTRVLFDSRLAAHWGVAPTEDGPSVRVCVIEPVASEPSGGGFALDADGLGSRYSDVIAPFEPLVLEEDAPGGGVRVFGWFGADRAQDEGLRVVMVTSSGLLSSLLVATDLDN